MKKVFFIFCLSLLVLQASAQTGLSIGARGGLNIPKLSASGDNPMSKGYQSKLASNAGVFAEIHFNESFSIQPMIEYSQQGGKRNGMQAIPSRMLPNELQQIQAGLKQDYLYADFDSETQFDYLMIPVLAKMGWNLGEISPFRVHVSAGPFVSFLLNATQVTHGNSFLYIDAGGDMTLDYLVNTLISDQIKIGERSLDVDRQIQNEMRSINYGISGNIGISYDLAQKHRLILETGANYGMVKLQKDPMNGQNRIGALTVTIGYAYRIK